MHKLEDLCLRSMAHMQPSCPVWPLLPGQPWGPSVSHSANPSGVQSHTWGGVGVSQWAPDLLVPEALVN